MAVTTKNPKLQFQIEYHGDTPTESGGTMTYSNIKPGTSDDNVDKLARAMNDLQVKIAKKIFKVESVDLVNE